MEVDVASFWSFGFLAAFELVKNPLRMFGGEKMANQLILLMEQIWLTTRDVQKPCKSWDKLPIN